MARRTLNLDKIDVEIDETLLQEMAVACLEQLRKRAEFYYDHALSKLTTQPNYEEYWNEKVDKFEERMIAYNTAKKAAIAADQIRGH